MFWHNYFDPDCRFDLFDRGPFLEDINLSFIGEASWFFEAENPLILSRLTGRTKLDGIEIPLLYLPECTNSLRSDITV